MSRLNFMSVKRPKIPRTRRSSAISTELQELKTNLRHDTVANSPPSDLHTHDGPVLPEQLRVAPTVAFREVNFHEDELECRTDGQANLDHGSNELPQKTDDGLASSETDTYSSYEVVLTVFSILSYIFDVGSDIYLAFAYYSNGDMWWFTLTVIFIIVPSLTITVFSFVWYIQDHGHRPYPLIWLPRVVLLFLQLGPLLRFISYFIIDKKRIRVTGDQSDSKLIGHW